ncbi:putative arsenate resistance operon repressor ArsD [Sulfobacillus acidophilus TPY]|uniref:Arsenical resistance operon trans-acting repressor ArsD n=1 Tax=Sulfobacillus acidophilus (strain ATCC 700253 / DSM 10332 / NAL) TaxID=679936 RepID=G8TTU4_SULAD|nr:putative arsenate resistance operon repressor ArsD [Sulfobacillus acidophilus TPY]AEW06853.1 Arsenical resistance operon trans-acting repressor ArsD [Sulfobacillus acidophilus DSM 10332]
MTVEIFDPELCCTSGVCGPAPDPVLIAMADVADRLQRAGVTVARYQLSRHPQAFLQNPVVYRTLVTEGVGSLPMVAVNGEVKWTGRYPGYEELMSALAELK